METNKNEHNNKDKLFCVACGGNSIALKITTKEIKLKKILEDEWFPVSNIKLDIKEILSTVNNGEQFGIFLGSDCSNNALTIIPISSKPSCYLSVIGGSLSLQLEDQYFLPSGNFITNVKGKIEVINGYIDTGGFLVSSVKSNNYFGPIWITPFLTTQGKQMIFNAETGFLIDEDTREATMNLLEKYCQLMND